MTMDVVNVSTPKSPVRVKMRRREGNFSGFVHFCWLISPSMAWMAVRRSHYTAQSVARVPLGFPWDTGVSRMDEILDKGQSRF